MEYVHHWCACRYQDQAAKLQVQNYQLSEELEQQKSKLKDINDFLVNELKARALSFAVLQSDLAEAKKTKDEIKESYEVCPHLFCYNLRVLVL
jgi:hypothetical protein